VTQELPDLASLSDKDELARLAPLHTPPTYVLPRDELALADADAAGQGPWWQRPRASAHGSGDHLLASIHEAEWSGSWVLQPEVEGERISVRVQVHGPPARALIGADAPAVVDGAIAEAVGAVRHAVTEPAELVVVVALGARATLLEIDLLEDGDTREGPWRELVLPDEDRAPVDPGPTRVWDLAPDLAVHVGSAGALLVLDPEEAFVWAGWAEGLGRGELAEELAASTGVDPDAAAARVGALSGAWDRLGTRSARPSAPPTPPAAAVAIVEALGRRVAVGAPDPAVLAGALALLPPVPGPGTGTDSEVEVDGWVEVHAVDGGWEVGGSHVAPRRFPSGLHLAALVRRAALAAALCTAEGGVLHATALAADGTAVVVLGPPDVRLLAARRWLDHVGHRVLADAHVRVVDGAVQPSRLGLVTAPDHQWIAGEPPAWDDPEAPRIGPSGEILHRWVPSIADVATSPLPVGLVVAACDDTGELVQLSPGHTLAVLLAARPDERYAIGVEEAEALVAVASSATGATGPTDARALVDVVRTVLRG
jgi:hypothetical protein